MTGNNKDHSSREELDSLGVELIRAAALKDGEAEEAVSTPFLFSRIRSEIETQKRLSVKPPRTSRRFHFPADLMLSAIRLSLAAILVVGATVIWTVWARSISQTQDQAAPRQVTGITACSLSDADKCVISTTDVVQLLVSGNSTGSNSKGRQ